MPLIFMNIGAERAFTQAQLEQAPQVQAEIAEMKWVDLDDAETLLAPLTAEVVMPWVRQHLASAEGIH